MTFGDLEDPPAPPPEEDLGFGDGGASYSQGHSIKEVADLQKWWRETYGNQDGELRLPDVLLTAGILRERGIPVPERIPDETKMWLESFSMDSPDVTRIEVNMKYETLRFPMTVEPEDSPHGSQPEAQPRGD